LSDEATILRRLHGKLRSLLGQDPVIFLRTLNEIADMVARDPFQSFSSEPDVKLYVAFLAERPRIKPQFPLLLPKEGLEAFAMEGREVFIVSRRSPNGSYGFPNNFMEKELRSPATSRNWNTVVKIVALAKSSHCDRGASRGLSRRD
jgi:uncharacterized protein (DUF1697 family)